MAALGRLAAVTTGWNDTSIEGYATTLAELDNPRALQKACERLATTWTEARRPPLAVIMNGYHAEALRLERPGLPNRERPIPPRQGVEVAREAYVGECKRLGKRADMDWFDEMVAPITGMMPT